MEDWVNKTEGATIAWGAIAAIAAVGLDVSDNSCTGAQCQKYDLNGPNARDGGIVPPLLLGGDSPGHFMLKEVRINGNTGWQGGVGAGPQSHPPLPGHTKEDPWPGSGWLHLIQPAAATTNVTGCMDMHTVTADRLEPRNLVSATALTAPKAVEGIPLATLKPAAPYDGDAVFAWANDARAETAVLLAEIDLASNPSVANRSVFLAANAQVLGADSLELMIDRGDGGWVGTAQSCADPVPESWSVHSTQAQLRSSGTARFALRLRGSGQIKLRRVAAAVVGTGWHRLRPPDPAPSSLVGELAQLAELREGGALTEREFSHAKGLLLGL